MGAAGDPGGILWRLRAEAAAAERGDLAAVALLARGADFSTPPAGEAEACELAHLQLRLERAVQRRAAELGHALQALPRFGAEAAPAHRRLDLRR